MINKNILVIGGAGYIGSHMVKLLKDKNYAPIVLDDLSGGYEDSLFGTELIRGNFGDKDLLNSIFSEKKN
jgi:UDP-glucose 4-epimerase